MFGIDKLNLIRYCHEQRAKKAAKKALTRIKPAQRPKRNADDNPHQAPRLAGPRPH
jgi:hypothetical protein